MEDDERDNDGLIDRAELERIMSGLDTDDEEGNIAVGVPLDLLDSGIIAKIGTRATVFYIYLHRLGSSNNSENGGTVYFDLGYVFSFAGMTQRSGHDAIRKLAKYNMIRISHNAENNGMQLEYTDPSEWDYKGKTNIGGKK